MSTKLVILLLLTMMRCGISFSENQATDSSKCHLNEDAKYISYRKFRTWTEMNALMRLYKGLLLNAVTLKPETPLILTSELNIEQLVNSTYSHVQDNSFSLSCSNT
jgi:hypothetical protein